MPELKNSKSIPLAEDKRAKRGRKPNEDVNSIDGQKLRGRDRLMPPDSVD